MESRPFDNVPQLYTDDHKRSHPTSIMTKSPFSRNEGKHGDQSDYGVKNRIVFRCCYRYTVFSLKKRLNRLEAPGFHSREYDNTDPRNPDEIFYIIALASFCPLIVYPETGFLEPGTRTNPSTEGSSKNQRGYKKEREENKAACDDSLGSPFND
jgi:hypothetical protein